MLVLCSRCLLHIFITLFPSFALLSPWTRMPVATRSELRGTSSGFALQKQHFYQNYERNVLWRLLVAVPRAGFAQGCTRGMLDASHAGKCANSHLPKRAFTVQSPVKHRHCSWHACSSRYIRCNGGL